MLTFPTISLIVLALVVVTALYKLATQRSGNSDAAPARKLPDAGKQTFSSATTTTQTSAVTATPVPEGDADGRHHAGDLGERIFLNKIRPWKGSRLNGYFRTANLRFQGNELEIDALLMVPGVGLVLAEVKFYKGELYCHDQPHWLQISENGRKQLPNATRQANRTAGLLRQMLTYCEMNDWPVIPAVVFTHGKARIRGTEAAQRSGVPVLYLSQFEGWLDSLPKDSKIRFSRDDAQRLQQMFKAYEAEHRKKVTLPRLEPLPH